MRATSQEVAVAWSVLKWARETIGKNIDDVAKRLDLGESVVEKWENGEKQPTLKQLRELSTFYKRPLAVFFLAMPPLEAPIPTDFRTLPKTVKKPFSEKTLLAMRRARRLQALAGDLNKSLEREYRVEIGQATLTDDPQPLAARARERLSVTEETQFKWEDETTALNEWKRRVEECGALVFELPFPIAEGRAFSFAEADLPAIVLNSNDAINARTFSLFHEYGHLLIGQSGICDLSEEGKAVEQFCNRFAGEVIVPRQTLLNHPLVGIHGIAHGWEEEELQQVAKQFKVSREVILRRLLILGRTTERFYHQKREEWELKLMEQQKKRRGGRRVPSRQCVRQNGVPFTSLVLESAGREKITYRDVSDYLAIGLKHLPAVESLVREARNRYG
ncbi:MAG: XRE family transcriptional regulator [Kiritimatiellae bacterium]|nr:XRE family transcriptional regulator [Kiritimatiellia bacterium]